MAKQRPLQAAQPNHDTPHIGNMLSTQIAMGMDGIPCLRRWCMEQSIAKTAPQNCGRECWCILMLQSNVGPQRRKASIPSMDNTSPHFLKNAERMQDAALGAPPDRKARKQRRPA
mmetsp:Transcript_71045/g.141148  ORF Transcript_71045/g.141148 Transcript_71045/m.141148 type:complete len:115 (-) Transcript_71045:374-718(-)